MNNLEKLILEKRGAITIGDKILIDLVLEEVQSEVEKYKNAPEIMAAGKRYLMVDGEKIPFGYPYPDTKEKYIIKSISTIINNLKVK